MTDSASHQGEGAAARADATELRVARAGPLAPPRPNRTDGEPRRVGVEIECISIAPLEAATLVQRQFGGRLRQHDPYRYVIEGARHGDFMVELDTVYAHPSPRWDTIEVESEWLAGLVELGREIDAGASALVGALSEDFVPMEIVAPPLPWPALDELSPLFRSIRDAGATGTDEGLLYALGLHLNPEAASLDAAWLTDMLRAYVLMSAWLRRSIDIDLTRRLLPFVDPFPRAYGRLVADPAYRPDMTTLIDDYLHHNATRNRELDMLPLFAHLDPERVRAAVRDDRVHPRPTFHYRLPNTRFTGADDGAVAEWNRWVLVERLAARPELMAEMGAAFREHFAHLVPGDWAARAEPYVRELLAEDEA